MKYTDQLLERRDQIVDSALNVADQIRGNPDQSSDTNKKFSISAFKGTLANKDFALSTHFNVVVHADASARELSMAACSAALPGFTMNTMETRRYGVGPAYSYPVVNVNGETQVAFYVDAEGIILRAFQDWVSAIYNFNVNKAESAPQYYVAKYKSQYVRDITISMHNRERNEFASYRLINAFPMFVGQMEMAWGESSIMKLPIVFKYDTYKFQSKAAETDPTKGTPGSNQVLQVIDKIGDAYNQVHDIRASVLRSQNAIRSIGSLIQE